MSTLTLMSDPSTMPSAMLAPGQTVFQFYTISEHGIAIQPECPEAEWEALAKTAAEAFQATGVSHCRMMAKLSDVLNFGFQVYGERASQIVDATAGYMRLQAKTLENAMTVFLKIPESRRRVDELTLEHHKAVQKLDEKEQVEFLDLAVAEGMSVSALKAAIDERHPKRKIATEKDHSEPDPEDEEEVTEAEANEALAIATRFFRQREKDHGSCQNWSGREKDKWKPALKSLAGVARRLNAKAKPTPAPGEAQEPVEA